MLLHRRQRQNQNCTLSSAHFIGWPGLVGPGPRRGGTTRRAQRMSAMRAPASRRKDSGPACPDHGTGPLRRQRARHGLASGPEAFPSQCRYCRPTVLLVGTNRRPARKDRHSIGWAARSGGVTSGTGQERSCCCLGQARCRLERTLSLNWLGSRKQAAVPAPAE